MNRPPATYTPERLTALYRNVEERLSRVPGVRGTALALYNPLTDNWGEGVLIAGHPPPGPSDSTGSSWDRVSTNYLQHLGVGIVKGRHFTPADDENAETVAVVNQAFVQRFFKNGEDPIDQHFGLNMPEHVNTFRIVGVVRDARFAGFALNRPANPMFYVPLAQTVDYQNPMMKRIEKQSHFITGLLLVTDVPTGTLEPQIKRALAEADPNLTVASVRTLQRQIDMAFNQQRAVASLAGLFGLVALALAAIGLYGVTAYSVAQRTERDRHPDGAWSGAIERVRHGAAGAFRRVAVGLVLGLPLAVGAGYLLSAQLYGVRFWDPLALGAGIVSLAACAFLAAIIPARRAAAVSPMKALRTE